MINVLVSIDAKPSLERRPSQGTRPLCSVFVLEARSPCRLPCQADLALGPVQLPSPPHKPTVLVDIIDHFEARPVLLHPPIRLCLRGNPPAIRCSCSASQSLISVYRLSTLSSGRFGSWSRCPSSLNGFFLSYFPPFTTSSFVAPQQPLATVVESTHIPVAFSNFSGPSSP
jgi:hypothetical protein